MKYKQGLAIAKNYGYGKNFEVIYKDYIAKGYTEKMATQEALSCCDLW